MGNLSAFYAQNAVKPENVKYAASKRFLDDKGEPEKWEIRCLTSSEDEDIRKACTKRVVVNGKRNQFTQEMDVNLYMGKLAAACTVYPNLDDAELQNSYKVMGADELLKTMLHPGEYNDYLAKVQEINGFDVTFEDLVDEAKN